MIRSSLVVWMFSREQADSLVRWIENQKKSNDRSNNFLDEQAIHSSSKRLFRRVCSRRNITRRERERRIASREARKQLPTLRATDSDWSDRFLEASKHHLDKTEKANDVFVASQSCVLYLRFFFFFFSKLTDRDSFLFIVRDERSSRWSRRELGEFSTSKSQKYSPNTRRNPEIPWRN